MWRTEFVICAARPGSSTMRGQRCIPKIYARNFDQLVERVVVPLELCFRGQGRYLGNTQPCLRKTLLELYGENSRTQKKSHFCCSRAATKDDSATVTEEPFH